MMTSRRCGDPARLGFAQRLTRRLSLSLSLAALISAATAGLSPSLARAQSAKASAEVLFAEGRRLMGEGKLEEACPKFADSQKLDPSSGTLLNLANCYEKLGRNASAWATYQEAASLASSTTRADHLQVAQKRATALLPMLAKVTVTVTSPVEGLEIKRDGVPVAKGEWGLAVPVDPGAHSYVASAPGYKAATVPLTVPPSVEGKAPPSLSLTIPTLEKAPVVKDAPGPASPGGASPGGASPGGASPGGAPESGMRPMRVGALVVGGLGVVGLGVAGAFAGLAKSKYSDSLVECPNDPNRCTSAGVKLRDEARAQGNIATGLLIGGGVAAAAGIVLWIAAPAPASGGSPRGEQRASLAIPLAISPAPGGLVVHGQW